MIINQLEGYEECEINIIIMLHFLDDVVGIEPCCQILQDIACIWSKYHGSSLILIYEACDFQKISVE